MKEILKCKHCDQVFENINKKVFANHVRWCDKNLTNGDKGKANSMYAIRARELTLKGELRNFIVSCQKCSKDMIVKEYEKCHPKKEKYFCSRKCGNSHVISQEMRERIGKKLRKE